MDATLQTLGARHGVFPSYFDCSGGFHPTAPETRAALLSGLGCSCSTEQAARESLNSIELFHGSFCWPVSVCRMSQQPARAKFLLRAGLQQATCSYRISCEDGSAQEGEFDAAVQSEVSRKNVNGEEWVERAFALPCPLPEGYHTVELELHVSDADVVKGTVRLIIAPDTCYQARARRPRRGLSLQLYSVPSRRNWGAGDFGDLEELIYMVSGGRNNDCPSCGLSFIGINPLHCVSWRGAGFRSPYHPTSRLALYALYLDLPWAISRLGATDLAGYIATPEFQERVNALRGPLVDYAGVMALKLEVMEKLFDHFRHSKIITGRTRADFRHYVIYGDKRVQQHAVHAALQEHFGKANAEQEAWCNWPKCYQAPDSAETLQFAKEHEDRVFFYAFVQWLAEQRLESLKALALNRGLDIGLYLDLALGEDSYGAETWMNQEAYTATLTSGAPPDAFAPGGQGWGVSMFKPLALQFQGYEPFIQLLRFVMRCAGALRIDHVMQLERLFCVPNGFQPKDGTYLSYPLEDLMGIVALESRRAKCVIIGEDLGTVSDRIRQQMQELHLLSYRLLWFMYDDAQRRFVRPAEFPANALAAVSTHDLATTTGWWQARDCKWRRVAGGLSREDYKKALERRGRERQAMLELLVEEGILPPDTEVPALLAQRRFPPELNLPIHRLLSRAPCAYQAVQLEDVLGQLDQPNLPGTTTEHPNWRRKLKRTLEEIDKKGLLPAFFGALNNP